jgi:hypothetical protein
VPLLDVEIMHSHPSPGQPRRLHTGTRYREQEPTKKRKKKKSERRPESQSGARDRAGQAGQGSHPTQNVTQPTVKLLEPR